MSRFELLLFLLLILDGNIKFLLLIVQQMFFMIELNLSIVEFGLSFDDLGLFLHQLLQSLLIPHGCLLKFISFLLELL